MTNSTKEKLEEIFAAVLQLPENTDFSKVRMLSEKGWDSLAQVTLILAVESEFGVLLDSTDHQRITSFNGTLLLLQEKLS